VRRRTSGAEQASGTARAARTARGSFYIELLSQVPQRLVDVAEHELVHFGGLAGHPGFEYLPVFLVGAFIAAELLEMLADVPLG
jgi:hypothetical protein